MDGIIFFNLVLFILISIFFLNPFVKVIILFNFTLHPSIKNLFLFFVLILILILLIFLLGPLAKRIFHFTFTL